MAGNSSDVAENTGGSDELGNGLGNPTQPGAPLTPATGGTSSGAGGDNGNVCAAVSSETTLPSLQLAVAFDVSGSMGKGDKPWHDRSLKWEPVVAALTGFFENPGQNEISASLTLFPTNDRDTRCQTESYEAPDVRMSALPSSTFTTLLNKVGTQEWRGGTPTLYALQGVGRYVEALSAETPGLYAIVLVTDGLPEGCDNVDISDVAATAEALAVNWPVFVVGVNNPPLEGAPDGLENLNLLAEAGGTGNAYIVDTGDPALTQQDLSQIISEIRDATAPCGADIPAAPDGRTFAKQRVSVTINAPDDDIPLQLTYAPDCAQALGWRYDDPESPTQVTLCPTTCETYRNLAAAQLQVEFACEDVISDLL